MREAWENAIVNDLKNMIIVAFDDEKDDSDFDAKEFMRGTWSDNRRHFHQHESAYIAKQCADMTYDEKDEYYKKVFKAAWELFAIEIQK